AYGQNAYNLEREVSSPIESSILTMRGVKEVKSTTQDGSGYIDVKIDKFVDLDYFRFDLSSKLRYLYYKFPVGVSFPTISELSNDQKDVLDQPILIYNISAPKSVEFIEKYITEELSDEIANLPGVSRLDVNGRRSKELQIDFDPVKLKNFNLNID